MGAAFVRFRPHEADFNRFKTALTGLLSRIDEADHENSQENYVRDFLRDSFYGDRNRVNKNGDSDLAIHV